MAKYYKPNKGVALQTYGSPSFREQAAKSFSKAKSYVEQKAPIVKTAAKNSYSKFNAVSDRLAAAGKNMEANYHKDKKNAKKNSNSWSW